MTWNEAEQVEVGMVLNQLIHVETGGEYVDILQERLVWIGPKKKLKLEWKKHPPKKSEFFGFYFEIKKKSVLGISWTVYCWNGLDRS